MLDFQTLEIPFGALDQKTSELTRGKGALERAVNVEFDKTGLLNKRRGYLLCSPNDVVSTFGNDRVLCAAVVHRNEVVIIGVDTIFALVDKTTAVDIGSTNASFAYRGPSNRGNGRLHHVSVGRSSQSADGAG